jgi:broad specificity phosphatase PhoE
MLLIRHGQSEFNVVYGETRQDPGIRDPKLTAMGRQQALQANKTLKPNPPDQIVSSPYWRALETATIIADILHLPITVTPLIAERAMFDCDIGTTASRSQREFPNVDFMTLDKEVWWRDGEEDLESLNLRCQQFRSHCKAGLYKDVIVVSHWGFIGALTNIRPKNCDIIHFDPTSDHPGGGKVVYHCDPC